MFVVTVWCWQVENEQDNTHVTSQKRPATVQNCKRRFFPREYWMIYQGKASSPSYDLAPPYLPSADCLSLLVLLCVADRSTDGRGVGVALSYQGEKSWFFTGPL
jgi:hypothetical protein